MSEQETYTVRDFNRAIRRIIGDLNEWKKINKDLDLRALALAITKLEEADMWALRILIDEDLKG